MRDKEKLSLGDYTEKSAFFKLCFFEKNFITKIPHAHRSLR